MSAAPECLRIEGRCLNPLAPRLGASGTVFSLTSRQAKVFGDFIAGMRAWHSQLEFFASRFPKGLFGLLVVLGLRHNNHYNLSNSILFPSQRRLCKLIEMHPG